MMMALARRIAGGALGLAEQVFQARVVVVDDDLTCPSGVGRGDEVRAP